MQSKKKLYIGLFLFIVFICSAGFIWSCTITRDMVKPEGKQDAKKQVISVKNLVLTETKDGEIYWELYAQKGSYDSKAAIVILENPTGNFYDSNQKVVMSFRSDVGTYYENNKNIILSGDVYVVTHDGSSINADEIQIKGKDEDIIAIGNIVVKRNDDFVSTAEKARFSSKLDFFEIEGKTETNVFSKDNEKVHNLVGQSEKK